MKSLSKKLVLGCLGLALAGCSNGGSFLDSKSQVPSAANIQVGNSLALPPDLQLAVPNQTSDAYQSNGVVAGDADAIVSKPLKQVASAAPIAPPPAKQDLYEQYGVSKTNPDGTPKKIDVLQGELKAAILKKKRETNPGYGTISNIGAIFQDQ